MNPVGLVFLGVAQLGLGIWIGARLADRFYRHAVASFPDRLQRAYDAGQASVLEHLTGLHAAVRNTNDAFGRQWVGDPPAWAAFQQGREKPWRN